jgi:hypothetical protein
MNLDFRKLSSTDQCKAIKNIIDKDPEAIPFLAHIISQSRFEVSGWFAFNLSNEGFDYWSDLMDKQRKKNDSKF